MAASTMIRCRSLREARPERDEPGRDLHVLEADRGLGLERFTERDHQRGLYWADRPHRFTAGMVYQLPFGQGKKLFNLKHGFFGRLVSGWEATMIAQIQSGRPWISTR